MSTTDINTMTVNGIEYVRADQATGPIIPSSKKIVVLQRGWVVIGDLLETEGDVLTLANASTIRVWGTTKGLGELRDGPTSKTVLDKAGTIQFHRLTVVMTIDVDAKKW